MPDPKTVATIGGVPILKSCTVHWTLSDGVRPNIEEFDVTPDGRDKLLGTAGSPVELSMTVNGKNITVTNLWVLQAPPGPDPYIARIRVADRRWFWERTHVLRRYNVRRNVGVKSLGKKDALDNILVAPAIQYALWSMKNRTPAPAGIWKIKDVLMDCVTRASSTDLAGPPTITVEDFDVQAGNSDGGPIEDTEIDDAGDRAVARILDLLPQAGLYIDLDGTVVIYSRVNGSENKAFGLLKPVTIEDGWIAKVSRRIERPKEVHVLFTRQLEVRFDYEESVTAANTPYALGNGNGFGKDLRQMENVMPVTDPELVLSTGEKVFQGTWITVDQAFLAWRKLAPPGGAGALIKSIDHRFIQRAMVPFMDLWGPIGIAGNTQPGINWPARIGMLQTHYRKTFRINRDWMDRILSVRAWMVATIDPTSGQRAPSVAYCDVFCKQSQRSMFRSSTNANYGTNLYLYPNAGTAVGNPFGKIGPDAFAAPANVSIVDEEQGIIHVDFRLDPSGGVDKVIPGSLDDGDATQYGGSAGNGMPTGDLKRAAKQPITFNGIANGVIVPTFRPSFRIAIIVTCVPASPNTEQQLQRVIVKANDVADRLPAGAAAGLNDANGPIWEIRCGAGVDTARVPWIDQFAKDVEAAFGVGVGDNVKPNLDQLIINLGANNGGASLNAIAKSVAAQLYGRLADHIEGQAGGMMNGAVKPGGWLDSVTHKINPDGKATTNISLPEELKSLNMFSLMDTSTRNVLMKIVQT